MSLNFRWLLSSRPLSAARFQLGAEAQAEAQAEASEPSASQALHLLRLPLAGCSPIGRSPAFPIGRSHTQLTVARHLPKPTATERRQTTKSRPTGPEKRLPAGQLVVTVLLMSLSLSSSLPLAGWLARLLAGQFQVIDVDTLASPLGRLAARPNCPTRRRARMSRRPALGARRSARRSRRCGGRYSIGRLINWPQLARFQFELEPFFAEQPL